MGVMWSSRAGSATDGLYLSFHVDGPRHVGTWSTPKAIVSGAGRATTT